MRWNRKPNVTNYWKPWFAWRPIRTEAHTVWLEWVERRCLWRAVIGFSAWEYKLDWRSK
jgi:hypothetical protein